MRFGLVLGFLASTAAAQPKAKPDPLAVVILIDRSASRKGERLDVAKDAVADAAKALAAEDAIGVIAFDDKSLAYSLLQSAGNHARLAEDVNHIKPGSTTADLVAGLGEAANMLKLVKARRKHIIVISDEDTAATGLAAAAKKVHEAGITITAVALADRRALQVVADEGNGRLYGVDDVGVVPRIAVKEIGELRKK
jgi:Ca-activated chloride channel homolog